MAKETVREDIYENQEETKISRHPRPGWGVTESYPNHGAFSTTAARNEP